MHSRQPDIISPTCSRQVFRERDLVLLRRHHLIRCTLIVPSVRLVWWGDLDLGREAKVIYLSLSHTHVVPDLLSRQSFSSFENEALLRSMNQESILKRHMTR